MKYLLTLSLLANAFMLSEVHLHRYTSTSVPVIMNNERLHQWASDIVIAAYPNSKAGTYDECVNNKADYVDGGTDIKLNDLQNACAIIVEGAEW